MRVSASEGLCLKLVVHGVPQFETMLAHNSLRGKVSDKDQLHSSYLWLSGILKGGILPPIESVYIPNIMW